MQKKERGMRMKLKKEYRSLIISVFACLFLLLIIPNQSQAQQMTTSTEVQKLANVPGNIHVGPLKIHPGVSVTESYTSNIFQEEDHNRGALITTVSPGIILQLPIQRHFLQLDYHADIIEAERFHKQYDTDSHFVNGILNLDFNRLNILAGDNWQSNSTPPQNKLDIRKDYLQNRAFCDVSYRLANRYKVTGFYRNTSRQFDDFRSPFDPAVDPRWDNYMENDMGIDLFYRFMPVTSVLFEYGFTRRNVTDRGLPDTDRDSDSQRYWLGFKWEPTAKIVGTIKGGYYQRNYDSGSTSKDWSGFAMENDLKYKLTSYDTFTLTGFRKPLETSVNASHVPGFAPGIYGTYYISSGGTLAYNHRFTYKISGIADVSFFNDDYQEKGSLGKRRQDDRFAGGIGALYQIQDWLAFKLGYRYTNNDSNADDESYRENLFLGTLSLNF
jgi:polysaccharide biosynthesis protein VpsM